MNLVEDLPVSPLVKYLFTSFAHLKSCSLNILGVPLIAIGFVVIFSVSNLSLTFLTEYFVEGQNFKILKSNYHFFSFIKVTLLMS